LKMAEEKVHEVALVQISGSYNSYNDEDSKEVISKVISDWQKVTDEELEALETYVCRGNSSVLLIRNIPRVMTLGNVISFDSILKNCMFLKEEDKKKQAKEAARREKYQKDLAAKRATTELKKAKALALKYGLIKQ
jgi:hypothetical protein